MHGPPAAPNRHPVTPFTPTTMPSGGVETRRLEGRVAYDLTPAPLTYVPSGDDTS